MDAAARPLIAAVPGTTTWTLSAMQTPLDVARQLAEQFRHQLQGAPGQKEAEATLHALIQAALARLDLVTREEFEAQREVLKRTRELADELQQRLAALEDKTPPD